MRNIVLLFFILTYVNHLSFACGDFEEEASYFNLLSQKIVQTEELFPFLRIESEKFYHDFERTLPDENIALWQQYFKGKLSYEDTKLLVYSIDNQSFNNHPLKAQFRSAFEYFTVARDMAKYAQIIPSEEAYYYWNSDDNLNVSKLPYESTRESLLKQYRATDDPDIKLRYAYQIVRFHHYYRKYREAVRYFDELVEPLGIKNFVYYLALEQKAGALSGLERREDANWAYFQVFLNTMTRKEVAFLSIKFFETSSFEALMSRAKSKEEKAGLWFLMAYDDFLNPIPFMQKIMEVDPESPYLKVLAIRSINEIERQALPIYQKCSDKICLKDDDLLFPMPLHTAQGSWKNPDGFYLQTYAEELEGFLKELTYRQKNSGLTDLMMAYLHLLKKEYKNAGVLLAELSTSEPYIKVEAERLLLLTEILSAPNIDPDIENAFAEKYGHLSDRQGENYSASTWMFIGDLLANRYLRQNELAKSFLVHKDAWEIRNFSWSDLAHDMIRFLDKPIKTNFEYGLISGVDTVYLINASNVIIGDHQMLQGRFSAAKDYYGKASGFLGLKTYYYDWGDGFNEELVQKRFQPNEFNGFQNIPARIFGYNNMECFECPEKKVMATIYLDEFNFIPPMMNKTELASIATKLEEIGKKGVI